MIGTTIGHYKIESKLGEGGMGVVYKATDTKLNRTVALKLLPERVQKDSEAKARFLQEAQAAAALNHPNICTIFGVDEVDGQLYMAMEFIEGGTLRESLGSVVGKVNGAVQMAVQIGDALQEAHAKGIVHRDIKADNVMVSAKGQAKVMDFGLAKLKGALKLTRTSSTVGTLGYMAPEQIQGGEVDPRSDIFSLGVLAFEMLTGKLPFRGEHEAAMMYSILNEAPESVQTFLPEASPDLGHILSRALEKDPEDRYQSMADMVSEMRRLLKQTTRISKTAIPTAMPAPVPSSSGMHTPPPTPPTEPAPRSKTLLVGAAAVAALAIIGGILFFRTGPSVELNPDMKLTVLDVPMPDFGYPGLSGDGNWITFTANTPDGTAKLFLMNVGGGEPRAIASETGVQFQHADLSFDASKIAYAGFPQQGIPSVYITSALGGGTRHLADTAILPRWKPDGSRIFYFQLPSLEPTAVINMMSITPDGKDARMEVEDALGVTLANMNNTRISMSPSYSGQRVAWIKTFMPEGYQEIFSKDLETGEERQLTHDKKNIDEVCWAPNGQILYSSNRNGNTNLWMISEEGGESVQITKGSGPDLGIRITSDLSKLLYYVQEQIGDLWIGSLRTGIGQQMSNDDKVRFNATLSPDGTRLAFRLLGGDALKPTQAIYVSDRDGSNRQAVTNPEPTIVGSPVWSPDGKRLAYSIRDPQDSTETAYGYLVDLSRPGSSTSLGPGSPYMWIDNDKLLLSRFSGTVRVTTSTGAREKIFQDSTVGFPVRGANAFFYRDHRVGHQGRWIVRTDNEGNTVGKPRKIMDILPFDASPNRDHITYLDNDGLWRVDLPSGQKRNIRNTFSGLVPSSSFTINPGTDEIVYTVTRRRSKLVMIENPFR